MEKNEINYLKFLEECRTYAYEKEALKQLEKRFTRFNRNEMHYENNHKRMDPIKRYRLLEAHIRHVDNVFMDIERTYGSKIAKTIKTRIVHLHSNINKDEIDEAYRNCITHILNKHSHAGGHYENYHS